MFPQHWATCWCRRPSVGQISSAVGESPTGSDYKTQNNGLCFHVPWSRLWSHRLRCGNLWYKGLYTYCRLFCLHGNIRPGNKTSLVFFSALKLFSNFFYFYLSLVGYIYLYISYFFKIECQYKLIFEYWYFFFNSRFFFISTYG